MKVKRLVILFFLHYSCEASVQLSGRIGISRFCLQDSLADIAGVMIIGTQLILHSLNKIKKFKKHTVPVPTNNDVQDIVL